MASKLPWQAFFTMELLELRFALRSTYDLLPTATNLKLWALITDDTCVMCSMQDISSDSYTNVVCMHKIATEAPGKFLEGFIPDGIYFI